MSAKENIKTRRKKKNYSSFLSLTQQLKKDVLQGDDNRKLSANANHIIDSLIKILIKIVGENSSLLLKLKQQKTVKAKTIIAAISLIGEEAINKNLDYINEVLDSTMDQTDTRPVIYHKAPRVLKHLKNHIAYGGVIRYGKYVGVALGAFIDNVIQFLLVEASKQTVVTSSRNNINISKTINSEHIKRAIAQTYLWNLFPRTYLPGASIPSMYEEIEKGYKKSPVKRKSPVAKKLVAKRKTPVKKTAAKRKTPVKKTAAKRKTPIKRKPAAKKAAPKRAIKRKAKVTVTST